MFFSENFWLVKDVYWVMGSMQIILSTSDQSIKLSKPFVVICRSFLSVFFKMILSVFKIGKALEPALFTSCKVKLLSSEIKVSWPVLDNKKAPSFYNS